VTPKSLTWRKSSYSAVNGCVEAVEVLNELDRVALLTVTKPRAGWAAP
jgi:Domain of unknown function (DUF397)